MSKVKKAVIPAAGLGTRMLPISKSVPKEMLPIDLKPALQYLIEEAANSGIEEVLIITALGKEAIEHHFTQSKIYEEALLKSGKTDLYDQIKDIHKLINIQYIFQHEQKGLGHAILCAKSFVGNDPFMCLYGDDMIVSKVPACRQLIDAYDKFGKCVAGMKYVPTENIGKFSSLKAEKIKDNFYSVTDMIEKPKKDEMLSNFSILGRVLLTSDIMGILENTTPGAGGEIQLTDAMKVFARTEGMIGVEYEGTRYDIGNPLSYLIANVDMGLKNKEYGGQFLEYLKSIVK